MLNDTRQQIITYIKEKNQATVDELAAFMSLTPMTVRYHLNVLQRDNFISRSTVRQTAGRGRPRQMYTLTQTADELFPVDYYSLTDYLLDELNMLLGQEGVDKLFCNIADRLAQEVPPGQKNQTIEARLDEIKIFLEEKGFVVDWESQADSYMIHAYSCPYRQIAKTHKQVCLLDKQVISAMLNTTPTRIACLTAGDSHCIYQVSKPIELMLEPAGN